MNTWTCVLQANAPIFKIQSHISYSHIICFVIAISWRLSLLPWTGRNHQHLNPLNLIDFFCEYKNIMQIHLVCFYLEDQEVNILYKYIKDIKLRGFKFWWFLPVYGSKNNLHEIAITEQIAYLVQFRYSFSMMCHKFVVVFTLKQWFILFWSESEATLFVFDIITEMYVIHFYYEQLRNTIYLNVLKPTFST